MPDDNVLPFRHKKLRDLSPGERHAALVRSVVMQASVPTARIPTGFQALDASVMGGLAVGEVLTVQGEWAHRTAFGLRVALAAGGVAPTRILAPAHDDAVLYRRLLSTLTGLEEQRIARGDLEPNGMETLRAKAETLSALAIQSVADLSEIEAMEQGSVLVVDDLREMSRLLGVSLRDVGIFLAAWAEERRIAVVALGHRVIAWPWAQVRVLINDTHLYVHLRRGFIPLDFKIDLWPAAWSLTVHPRGVGRG